MGKRIVQCHQLWKKDAIARESVEDEVMQRYEHPIVVVFDAYQLGAEKRPARQVERQASVLGGQTLTTNIKLTPSAVAIGPVLVEAAANPIVPRDQVTSKTSVSAADLQNLPVEDLRSVIDLQPGVVESGKGRGVSIRGGRPGEAATYVDGVLVPSLERTSVMPLAYCARGQNPQPLPPGRPLKTAPAAV